MDIKNKVLIISIVILACTTSLFLLLSQSNLILAYAVQRINVDNPQGQIQKVSMDKNLILDDEVQSKFYSNPRFVFFDNQSGMINFGLRSYWQDSYNSCKANFKCTDDASTTWKNNTSLRLSTKNNTNNTWTSIQGRQVFVEQNQSYTLVTHMRLNDFVIQSHVAVEGLNVTSNEWYQITQCPSGLDGPLGWKEFNCTISIPGDTTEIRPVLNAGWSSKPNEEATTWFDSFYITKSGYLTDPKLKIEKVSQKLDFPTGIAFLGHNDILALEKDKGTVQRIVNGVQLDKPLLDLDVRNNDGLLAIATNKNVTVNKNGIVESVYVYLYFTSAEKKANGIQAGAPAMNLLYRYQFLNNSLVNPKLLMDIPAGFMHNGGKIVIGPDKLLYLIVGEIRPEHVFDVGNKALNYVGADGNETDGRGGILWMDQDGRAPHRHGILGDEDPLNKYYAYGVRNSFGMDIDPLSGKLWDTENGPEWGDEINLVEPGFNSGWNKVQGVWTLTSKGEKGVLASEAPENLTDFDKRGIYSSPEFTWTRPVGPTDVKFLSTDKLGKDYENQMLVADVNNHKIYHFKLNQNRSSLLLDGSLSDRLADNNKELDPYVFAQGFNGVITDMEIGPDGYLYVLADQIYRISPISENEDIYSFLDRVYGNSLGVLKEIL